MANEKLRDGMRWKGKSIEYRWTFDGETMSVSGKTVKECLKKAQQKMLNAGESKLVSKDNLTMDIYFQEWCKRKELEVKESTIDYYMQSYSKHIKPTFGKAKIGQIEPRMASLWFVEVCAKMHPNSANHLLALLHSIFKTAESDGIIPKNPTQGIKKVKVPNKKEASETIHRALTIEEQKAFIKVAQNDFYYNVYAFMLCTGLRIGEVCALDWRDIDYKNKVIHITKSLTKTKNKEFIVGTPKTSTSYRDIPVTAQIEQILRENRKRMSYFSIDGYVFLNTQGKMLTEQTLRKSLAKLCTSVKNFDPITPHAFRDTFATRFIESGGNMNTLKELLGHSSITITMDLYAHVLPNTKAKEMEKLTMII